MENSQRYTANGTFQNENLDLYPIPGIANYYATKEGDIYSDKRKGLNDLQYRIVLSLRGEVPQSYLAEIFGVNKTAIHVVYNPTYKRKFGFLKLSKCINTFGYPYVLINIDGKTYNRTVHSLVLLTFKGKRKKGMVARHLDGIKLNPHINNLAWGTMVENARDKVSHGTNVPSPAYLTDDQIIEMRFGKRYRGYIADMARKYNVDYCIAYNAITGITFKHLPMPEQRQKAAA